MDIFNKICLQLDLGEIMAEPTQLKGGFMHKMYSLFTTKGKYANIERLLFMIFDKTIYVSDIISIISLISAVVGGFFAYVQWKETVRNKRADYINDLTEKIRTDEDIRDIIYCQNTMSLYRQSLHF